MFAPAHHSAMKHAIGPRKELAVRTIFNVLGPLTNPAKAPNQIMGVYDKGLVEPIANVLKGLNSRHVMVVHSEDGLDEFSIAKKTYVAELKDNNISTYTVHPHDFGFEEGNLDSIKAENADQSLALINEAFSGKKGVARDIIALNAGAAIYVSGLVNSLNEGIQKAKQVLSDGTAREKLEAYIHASNS
jgi:anthranilate phosphoribosyltransferase